MGKEAKYLSPLIFPRLLPFSPMYEYIISAFLEKNNHGVNGWENFSANIHLSEQTDRRTDPRSRLVEEESRVDSTSEEPKQRSIKNLRINLLREIRELSWFICRIS